MQAEFENTLTFSLSLARSAKDPDDPESARGFETEPFYLDQTAVDPENGPLSMFDFTFDEVVRRPAGGAGPGQAEPRRTSRCKYQINGGPAQSVPTREWTGGETYGVGKATYYRVMSGTVPRHQARRHGRGVVRGRPHAERLVHYTAVSESRRRRAGHGGRGLHRRLAGLRRPTARTTCRSTRTPSTPTASAYDVYDVDANGRVAPDALGVLEPLQRGHLVHGRRRHHPRARMGRGQRLDAWR